MPLEERNDKKVSGPAKLQSGTDKYLAFTPGSGINDFPDCAEKHKGSCMDTLKRSTTSRNLEDNMIASISIAILPPKAWNVWLA